MINVNQITAQMARMSDPALQQYAAMHKADPYTLSLALSESNRRKELRQGAQMQQQPQPKVVDQEIAQMTAPTAPPQGVPPPQGMPPQQLPEDVGIGQLPAPNMQRMAAGGIVAFDEGGEVPGYASGTQVKDFVQKYAEQYDVDPAVLSQIIGVESGAKGAEAKNPKSSAHGFGQIIEGMWGKSGGGNRSDPETQVRNAANLLSKNNKTFLGATGRLPTASEAYTTWVLGDSTGRAVLNADPNASVEAVIRKADPKLADQIISANKSVFGGKKVGDVMAWSEQKMLPVIAGGAAVAGTEPPKANGVADLTKPFIGNPNIARQASTARATVDKNTQLRLNSELPAMIKQVEADRASNAARIPGQAADSAGYGANMPVADEARQRLVDRYAAESKGTFFGRLGENLGIPADTRGNIGQLVEGLAPYAGGAATVVRAPVVAKEAAKITQPLRIPYSGAVKTEAGIPSLVPRIEGPSSIAGGSKPIPVNPEGVAALPKQAELVGQAAVDDARLRMMADASNAAKAQRAQNLKTGEQLLAQKSDLKVTKAAQDAEDAAAAANKAASQLDNRVPNTVLANKIDQGVTQAANVAKVGAMTNAADRFIAGPSEGGLPDMAKAMNLDEENRVIQQAPPDIAPKDIQKLGKEATPKDERKGMSGEDYLMIGLGILSGQSPNALVNIGEGGLKGLQMVMAGRKEAAESRYRDALAKNYGVSPEIQLVNAMQDPAFAANYNKLMEAKNDPAQLRVLSQEIVKNPAQMEVLKKLDPAMYSMLRATLVGGFMPPPVSAPGGSAAIRAPIQ